MAIMSGLKGGKSNADKRRALFLRDQHGRRWFANVDTVTDEPVGQIMPAGEPMNPDDEQGLTHAPWSAPWYPAQKYLVRKGRYRLEIDYPTMIADLQREAREYRQLMIREGIRLHGQAFNPDQPTVAVLHEIGPAPDPVEPYVAMLQGNKFALGFSKDVDERLRPYLPRAADPAAGFRGDEFADAEPVTVRRGGRRGRAAEDDDA